VAFVVDLEMIFKTQTKYGRLITFPGPFKLGSFVVSISGGNEFNELGTMLSID